MARSILAAASVWVALLLPVPAQGAADKPGENARRCAAVVETVHDAVVEAGVSNAAAVSVAGAPFLRANRFLSAMAERVRTPEQVAAWAGWMRQVDRSSRPGEIAALNRAERRRLAQDIGASPTAASISDRYETCAEALLSAALSQNGFDDRLREKVSVPDEYVLGYRIFGLYPLAAMPVASLTRRSYRTFLSWHRSPPEKLPVSGQLTAYAAKGARPEPILPETDVLGVPVPDAEQAAALLRFFAPVFLVDRTYEFDRPGAVALRDGKPVIEDGPPAVYHYLSYTFFRGRPALQLNYVLWFGERGGQRAPRIEHGRLDGLTVRITLDREGRAVMADVMNNCGCYHFFLPAPGLVSGMREDPGSIEPLVADTLPEDFPRHPLTLRINAGWHQVDAVWAAPPPQGAVDYRLVPYRLLEALTAPNGQVESLFTPTGIAKGTARIEPLILFSMGIPDIGSMRQRGHHAIKLIGRAHFDDPYLLDRTFQWR
jgi:hypothetical protein